MTLGKLLTPTRIFVIMVAILLVYILTNYSNDKQWNTMDSYTGNGIGNNYNGIPSMLNEPSMAWGPSSSYVQQQPPPLSSSPTPSSLSKSSGNYSSNSNITNPSDLLPKDGNSDWTRLNPASNNNGIVAPDLLSAGSLIGLDTVGQTLRNANLQLRSDPVIPVAPVGPWNQSTIEPDLIRAPFEVNSCTR